METKMKMEKFGYNKAWKAKMLMECSYPVIFLLGVLAIGLFIVWPSGGVAEFKWWMPLLVIGLIIWAIIEIGKYRKALAFLVELSEETIRVGDKRASWADISKVESRRAFGDVPAIILHTNSGTSLNIPAATESLPYIKGFIDNRTKST